jgi:hypothetical protein
VADSRGYAKTKKEIEVALCHTRDNTAFYRIDAFEQQRLKLM